MHIGYVLGSGTLEPNFKSCPNAGKSKSYSLLGESNLEITTAAPCPNDPYKTSHGPCHRRHLPRIEGLARFIGK